jgi:hypothetical protein
MILVAHMNTNRSNANAQYDVSYDVRDRARFANAILFSEGAPHLKDRAADIFLATKPAPKFVDVAGVSSAFHVPKHQCPRPCDEKMYGKICGRKSCVVLYIM